MYVRTWISCASIALRSRISKRGPAARIQALVVLIAKRSNIGSNAPSARAEERSNGRSKMRRRHILCVASAKLSCDVDASRPLRAPQDEAGAGASVFGYFWGNAKSDWPRAAIERAGGKEQSSFSQTLRRAQGEPKTCASRRFTHWIPASRG